MKLSELVNEAAHSFLIYDTYSKGINNVYNMKWPDATMSAIAYIEATDETKKLEMYKLLVSDLVDIIYKPLYIIAKSMSEYAASLKADQGVILNIENKITASEAMSKIDVGNAKVSIINVINHLREILISFGKECPKIPKKLK